MQDSPVYMCLSTQVSRRETRVHTGYCHAGDSHRNILFAAKIWRQQGSQKLLKKYVRNNHAQDT